MSHLLPTVVFTGFGATFLHPIAILFLVGITGMYLQRFATKRDEREDRAAIKCLTVTPILR